MSKLGFSLTWRNGGWVLVHVGNWVFVAYNERISFSIIPNLSKFFAMSASLCEILFSNDGLSPIDSHGCRLDCGHDGPHEFLDERGSVFHWETDLECDCEHCQRCEGDYCITYWPVQLAGKAAGAWAAYSPAPGEGTV